MLVFNEDDKGCGATRVGSPISDAASAATPSLEPLDMLVTRTLITYLLPVALVSALPLGCNDAGSAPKPAPAGSGALHFDHTEFDFGTTVQQSRLTHRFPFTNIGGAPARILRVKTACGCTIPRYPREPIAPGEQGELELIFESGALTGEIAKGITVFTDNPEDPTVEIRVRAEVRVEFWIEPSVSQLGDLGLPDEAISREFRICWAPESEIQITDIEKTTDALRIRAQTPFQEADVHGLRVEYDVVDWTAALENSQSFDHYFVVKTDHPRYPRTMHPVRGTSAPALTVAPRVVNFGVIERAEPIEKKVRLAAAGRTPLILERYEAPDYILVEAAPGQHERSLVLTIRMLPGAPRGSLKETVRLHTNVAAQPEVSIYVLANIKTE